jgi:hypothetical protein
MKKILLFLSFFAFTLSATAQSLTYEQMYRASLKKDANGNFVQQVVTPNGALISVDLSRYTMQQLQSMQYKKQPDGTYALVSSGGSGGGTFTALSGDVTSTSTGGATTINNGVITNAKLATMPSLTMKANGTGSASPPQDLTIAQVKTLLNLKESDMTTTSAMTIGGTVYAANTSLGLILTALNSATNGKLTANAPIAASTKTKISYDANGLVTAGTDATNTDIITSAAITVGSITYPIGTPISTVESALATQVTANKASITNAYSLSGVPYDATNLGTFTGVLIPDNATIKSALQEVEMVTESNTTIIGALNTNKQFNIRLAQSGSPVSTSGNFTKYNFIGATVVQNGTDATQADITIPSAATNNTLTATGGTITSTVNGIAATLTPVIGTIATQLGFNSAGDIVKQVPTAQPTFTVLYKNNASAIASGVPVGQLFAHDGSDFSHAKGDISTAY